MSEKHPIRVVSKRTGVNAALLRVWERRYGAVQPERTPTGRRLYSSEDLERVLLLRRATLAGRGISHVAKLGLSDLKRIVEGDEAAIETATRSHRDPASRRGSPPIAAQPASPASIAASKTQPTRGQGKNGRAGLGQVGRTAADHLRGCIDLVVRLDSEGLERALSDSLMDLSRPDLIEHLLVPLMREIGERWRSGRLRVCHEHLASAVVRSFLGSLREFSDSGPGAPRLLAATPAGQMHEFGALFAAATAASDGWKVTYLGAGLPAHEIAHAARETGARVVALSILQQADDAQAKSDLGNLRRLIPPSVTLVLGGPGAERSSRLLPAPGAVVCPTLSDLRALLDRELTAEGGA